MINLFLTRSFQLGIAIILVILYHLYCIGYTPFLLEPFRFGFVGVDIFLFFSGIGLCSSYVKNSTMVFYKRRFLRIYPLFFVVAVYASIFQSITEKHISVWDWFCNLTTLSYYDCGGRHFEWYLMALIALYVIFPFLYIVLKKYGMKVHVLISILVIIVCNAIPLKTDHLLLISRIPIFCLGILFYFQKANLTKYNYWFVSIALFVVYAIISAFLESSRYLICSFLSPIMILILCWLYRLIYKKGLRLIENSITKLGTITLELYCAQIPTMSIIMIIPLNKPSPLVPLIYFMLQIIFSLFFIAINKMITKHMMKV